MIHRRTHPQYVEGCWACRVSSVQLAPSATPSRHPQAVEVNEREKRWERDMPAYKELRRQGVQPKGIDGAADIAAQAETRLEIEMGRVMSSEERKVAADLPV